MLGLSFALGLLSLVGAGFISNLLVLHVYLARRRQTTLEYSRFLREQYLAQLAREAELASRPPEGKSGKVGFWALFYSRAPSRKVVPETE